MEEYLGIGFHETLLESLKHDIVLRLHIIWEVSGLLVYVHLGMLFLSWKDFQIT